MQPTPRSACLILADISGYTTYLAGAELDHAQDVLADLMDTVVSSLRPMFRLAKLEGDAAFVYAEVDHVDSSGLQDTVEGCYFAFRRRLRDIRQATTCPCNACILIPTLDLKLVAHHGVIARQRMAGREELVGRDVIVAHRLLKNEVEARLGIAAYALYTDACLAAMGVDDPASAGLLPHRETYEVIGEVGAWVRDLHAVWRAEEERARIVVDAADAGWTLEAELPAPPAIVWAFATTPELRIRWQESITGLDEDVRGGRRGVGTINHCQHGKETTLEEILDWQPAHHRTVRVQMPIPGAPKATFTDLYEPTADGGTRFTMRVKRPRSVKDRVVLGAVWPTVAGSIRAGIAAIEPLLHAEMERLAGADSEDAPEPVDSASAHSS